MTKKQLHIRASARTCRQLEALTIGGATITEIVTVAVDRMYRSSDHPECWWHWAIRSEGGRQAIKEAELQVDFLAPWRGISDPDMKGHWRAQPWISPNEDHVGHCWEGVLAELRRHLGEQAGIFFIEHISYVVHWGSSGNMHWPSNHMTLIAVSADGKRSAWRRVYAGSPES